MTSERKLTPNDATALIVARRARHPQHLKRLVEFHRSRGVSDREIAQAMADSPAIVDAIGPGVRRDARETPITRITIKWPQQP
jgi:hypothetical protein